jgi:hypothetical protein
VCGTAVSTDGGEGPRPGDYVCVVITPLFEDMMMPSSFSGARGVRVSSSGEEGSSRPAVLRRVRVTGEDVVGRGERGGFRAEESCLDAGGGGRGGCVQDVFTVALTQDERLVGSESGGLGGVSATGSYEGAWARLEGLGAAASHSWPIPDSGLTAHIANPSTTRSHIPLAEGQRGVSPRTTTNGPAHAFTSGLPSTTGRAEALRLARGARRSSPARKANTPKASSTAPSR